MASPGTRPELIVGRLCAATSSCVDVVLDTPEVDAGCARNELVGRVDAAFRGQRVPACEGSLEPLPEVDALTFPFEVAADGRLETNTASLAGEGPGLARGEEGALFGCLDGIAAALKKLEFPTATAACRGKLRMAFVRR